MADWRQREIRKECECDKSRDTASIEELMIESTDTAVQEEIVMVARYHTRFAHRTVEGSCWYEFSANIAAVSITRRLCVLFEVGQFVVGNQQCHLIVVHFSLILIVAKTVD